MYTTNNKIVKNSFLNNQILGALLIFLYCAVYGVTSYIVFNGLQLLFFITSLVFALSVFYVRDPEVQKAKIKKGILFSQVIGTCLVFAYILVFGISSFAILNGFKLVFFMSSYTFVLSIFYIRDPERIKKEEVSSSSTNSPFTERNPCFVNSKDLSWLVRELNSALSTIIGFIELMLKREYNEREKDFMLREIHDKSILMSHSINKVSNMISDSPTSPQHIEEPALVEKNNLSK